MYIEIFIVGIILAFVYVYRKNTGDAPYKFIVKTVGNTYEKYAPYSFKVVREKAKELGQEYTPRQYTIQCNQRHCHDIISLLHHNSNQY